MRKRVLTLTLAAVFVAVLMATVPTAQASASGGVHCVKYGETLYGIASYYGTSAYAIAHANGIYNPNYIKAGSCLHVPSYGYGGHYASKGYGYGKGHYGGSGYGYAHGPRGAMYGYQTQHGYGYGYKSDYGYGHGKGYGKGYAGYGYKMDYGKGYGHGYSGKHCVRYGETLSRIAYHYGTSTWAIAKANGLHNPNYIYAGQCLHIPSY